MGKFVEYISEYSGKYSGYRIFTPRRGVKILEYFRIFYSIFWSL